MKNAGIDYGLGRTNIDLANGIRYGVISQHSVSGDALAEGEPIYPDTIPVDCTCGHSYEGSMENNKCPECEEEVQQQDFDMIEPIGWDYAPNSEEYSIDSTETDLFITKSPYYTFTKFCSPCAPGAGDLNNPVEGGVKAYCLGHDWFEDGRAPYPVYAVANDEPVNE